MSLDKLPGYNEAIKAVEANLSPRARHMRDLERYVDGTQYDGLPDWFSAEKPLWERAPCIVYPIVQSAIDSNGDLLLGDDRFPTFGLDGLEGTEAEAFDGALSRIAHMSRLPAGAREVFAAAQGCGSACAIFGIRSNRLFIDTTRASWCTPQLDVDGGCLSLEIRYAYIATEIVRGERRALAKIYRRTIDEKTDITYLPVDATTRLQEPKWAPDPARSITHSLGFCPVVWYPHMRGCAAEGDVDGRAIHEHITDEIRAHDFALSQRHRAALYCGDPQWTEVGVAPGYNPTSSGRRVEVPASIGGRPGETPHASYVSGGPKKARKKGPGSVWQYEAKDVQVKLHTLPGDALKALDDHARDLRVKLAESLGVVFLDPETLPRATALSGRALEALKARQLDRCDQYRSDFGDRFLLPAQGMQMRIAIARTLPIEGLEAISTAIEAAKDRWSWRQPPLSLTYGRYFRLDADDETKQVQMVAAALDARVATKRAAVEKLRAVFDIKDVDAYLAALETEKQEAMAESMKLAADMSNDGTNAEDSGKNPGGNGGGKPFGPGKANGARADSK